MKTDFEEYKETGMIGAYYPERAIHRRSEGGVITTYRDCKYRITDDSFTKERAMVINGKTYSNAEGKSAIGIWAFTKENFSGLTQDQKADGPRPKFAESTYSFGKIKRGETVHATYTFKNEGKECFCVYKVNADARKWSHSTIPAAMPGEEVSFRVHLDTEGLPLGEHLTIVTLTTNSPLRPIVNLFIAGYIE